MAKKLTTTISLMIEKMDKELKDAASIMTAAEARILVDCYYAMQGDRIAYANRAQSITDLGAPSDVLSWLSLQSASLEGHVKTLLDKYSEGNRVGRWMRSQVGIGPVIAAGFLAHFDIKQAPTAGHFFRYAGLDPTSKWLGSDKASRIVDESIQALEEEIGRSLKFPAELDILCEYMSVHKKVSYSIEHLIKRSTDANGKRSLTTLKANLAKIPWNAGLKVLVWKAGESFIKVQRNEDAFYGQLFATRKATEWAMNQSGKLAEAASAALREKKFGADTDAIKWYSGKYSGVVRKDNGTGTLVYTGVPAINGNGVCMLPPAHIHARARRFAAKIFVSHIHHVMYLDYHGVEPPKPYAVAHLGHAHVIEPPNLELVS